MVDFDTVQDSGVREEMDSGSQRDTRKGKGRYDLLPTRAIRRLAQHFENGATKYGDRNWEKGQPTSRYLDSAMRHLFAVLEGKTDEDHAAAVMWNIACLIETQERIAGGLLDGYLDDLSKYHNDLYDSRVKEDFDDLIEKAAHISKPKPVEPRISFKDRVENLKCRIIEKELKSPDFKDRTGEIPSLVCSGCDSSLEDHIQKL